jgi:hypothetical protein
MNATSQIIAKEGLGAINFVVASWRDEVPEITLADKGEVIVVNEHSVLPGHLLHDLTVAYLGIGLNVMTRLLPEPQTFSKSPLEYSMVVYVDKGYFRVS